MKDRNGHFVIIGAGSDMSGVITERLLMDSTGIKFVLVDEIKEAPKIAEPITMTIKPAPTLVYPTSPAYTSKKKFYDVFYSKKRKKKKY